MKYGNGPLDQALMASNLIDEFHLLLTPVAAGSGRHLFEEIHGAPRLSLADVRRFASDVLILIYTPQPRSPDNMALDLFAGIPIRDYPVAAAWYERLLGAPPSFLPNDSEAVWEVAGHRYLYIVVRPRDAGHAIHTLFAGDFDARIAQIAKRGLEPTQRETYANGVRKATFRDPDGNEIGFGGAPP